MSKVAYSKKRIVGQAGTSNFMYKKIKPGTILTIQDVLIQDFEDHNGNKVMNDMLLVVDDEDKSIKLSVKEFMKMKVKDGERYDSASDTDDIKLPNQIKIISSEDRMGLDEKEPRYPTYAYNGAEEFIASKGALDYKKDVIESGLKDDNTFEPLQNYIVELS